MNSKHQYKGVQNSTWVLHKDKGSKFIARVFSANNSEEVKEKLLQSKAEYPDATHWCWAAITNFPNTELKSNDNGEPNGTAGLPILRQLQSAEVNNSILVVVRYFGGTKLGTRGLIDAYGAAALLALQNCTFSFITLQIRAMLECTLEKENLLYAIANKLGLEIVNTNYNLLCAEMTVQLAKSKERDLLFILEQYYEVKCKWL